MRVADRIILYRAQAKPLAGVIGRLLQPPVVEHQRFGLAIFQKQLAIVSPGKPPRDLAADGIAVEVGAVEQGGCGGIGHEDSDNNFHRPGLARNCARGAGTNNHRPLCF